MASDSNGDHLHPPPCGGHLKELKPTHHRVGRAKNPQIESLQEPRVRRDRDRSPVQQQPPTFKHSLPKSESAHVYHSYTEDVDPEEDKDKIISAYALRKASIAMQRSPRPKPKHSYPSFLASPFKEEEIEEKPPEPLIHYKDKNCEILGTQLIVESYWWPFWFSFREFDITEIKSVWYETMDEIIGSTWGLGLHCTYWSLKCCRECSQSTTEYNVVLEYKDETFLKGFTVEDIDTFLMVISQNLMPSVPIIKATPALSRESLLNERVKAASKNYNLFRSVDNPFKKLTKQ